jgi:hypothetical protein
VLTVLQELGENIDAWRSQAPWRSDAKVEINSREHFTVLGTRKVPFAVIENNIVSRL